MTQRAKTTITEIRAWLPAAIVVITAAISWGAFKSEMRHNAEEDDEHRNDKALHMPYEDKVRTFVSRVEFDLLRQSMLDMDARQRAILNTVSRMEAVLDRQASNERP